MKYLIAGLGNIGPEYELTRHNAGFLVLDQLAEKLGCTFELNRYADYAVGKYKGRTLHLIKPTTFMNLSGRAVNYWMNDQNIEKSNTLVVTDDIALPFAKLRLRKKGSDAGHNGLKSIDLLTSGNDYPRLRFGIGGDFHKGQQVDYVLSRFTQQELDALTMPLGKAVEMILSFVTVGITRTMNTFN